jgi:hypothetical protein
LLLPLQSFLFNDFAQAAGVSYEPEDDELVASVYSPFFGVSFKLLVTNSLGLKATGATKPPLAPDDVP